MTQLLIRLFVRHPDDTKNAAVRTAYGNLASLVGMACNLLLCLGKLAAGTLFGSIAIMADALNNLSDASSNVVSLVGFIGVIWAIVCAAMGSSVAGWASTVCIVCFMGGVQLVCLGVIGEYIGKIYMETKARPRYIISERTWAPYERKYHG